MATATGPDVLAGVEYETWLDEVQVILATMNMEVDAWQESWKFDFLEAYNAGLSPTDAAQEAHDFWWQQVLDESWT
jgi:hypothetical protein